MAATNGATYSGWNMRKNASTERMKSSRTLRFASISGGIMVSVMAEAAIGAIAVDLMPYFAPSRARVLEKAIKPIFAAL